MKARGLITATLVVVLAVSGGATAASLQSPAAPEPHDPAGLCGYPRAVLDGLRVGWVLSPLCSARPGSRRTVQEERGLLLTPMPGRIGSTVVDGCPGVLRSTAYWAMRASLAARFSVSKISWGRPFSLVPDHQLANLDITFFGKGASGSTAFDSFELGGEHGLVPTGAVEAFVCLAHGAPAHFLYRAY